MKAKRITVTVKCLAAAVAGLTLSARGEQSSDTVVLDEGSRGGVVCLADEVRSSLLNPSNPVQSKHAEWRMTRENDTLLSAGQTDGTLRGMMGKVSGRIMVTPGEDDCEVTGCDVPLTKDTLWVHPENKGVPVVIRCAPKGLGKYTLEVSARAMAVWKDGPAWDGSAYDGVNVIVTDLAGNELARTGGTTRDLAWHSCSPVTFNVTELGQQGFRIVVDPQTSHYADSTQLSVKLHVPFRRRRVGKVKQKVTAKINSMFVADPNCAASFDLNDALACRLGWKEFSTGVVTTLNRSEVYESKWVGWSCKSGRSNLPFVLANTSSTPGSETEANSDEIVVHPGFDGKHATVDLTARKTLSGNYFLRVDLRDLQRSSKGAGGIVATISSGDAQLAQLDFSDGGSASGIVELPPLEKDTTVRLTIRSKEGGGQSTNADFTAVRLDLIREAAQGLALLLY